MYLLFVDESGTHGGSHAFVLGGLAIHENDARRLQKDLDNLVIRHLGKRPQNLDEFELHAAEMRNAKKPKPDSKGNGITSIWAGYPREMRRALLDEAYDVIAGFEASDERLPVALFGIVLDRNFRPDWTQIERERHGYEVLLNKFDVMLKTTRVRRNLPNLGLVIHDRRVVAERDIQTWTSEWRVAAGNVGRIKNLADVPLFADSRATRLLQVADLVSYSIFRRFNPEIEREPSFEKIWPKFHREKGQLHGCIHFSPSYGQGNCDCEPCAARVTFEPAQRVPRNRASRPPIS